MAEPIGSPPPPPPATVSPTVQLAVRELAGIPDPATRAGRAFADLQALEDAFAEACLVLWNHRGRLSARACAKEANVPTARFVLGVGHAERFPSR